MAWAILLRKAVGGGHASIKARVAAVGERVPAPEVERWAAAVLAEHGNEMVLAVLREHAGRTIISTAAPEVYARAFGRLLHVDDTIGSGLIDGRFVDDIGPEKGRQLRRRHGLREIEVAVTDDPMSDACLLGMASRGWVVDQDGRLASWSGVYA